ncbi:hypothetical protein ACHAWO_012202 [Cyclotella atomus]|uniref:PPIase cyclophilin-type domain-containing protein n=1 Tax=Cyclotella atomus TaxID=382360 RepID=A0ABD3PE63_9STRA
MYKQRIEATIPPRGGAHHSQTFVGHEFYYEYDGDANYVLADRPNANDEQLIAIGGKEGEGIRVRCEISVSSGNGVDFFDILVQPYWSPRGAIRFLELVRFGVYNGVAFNRVVPNFLTQFGIPKDYEMRKDAREISIWDDFNQRLPFEPGYVSFAGSGFDSRTTELFIVMPGVSKAQ